MSDCWHNTPNCEPKAGAVQTKKQQLDETSREELVDRLVDCLYCSNGDFDIEAIDRCLEELEGAGDADVTFDVEQELRDFHERFDDAFESSVHEVKNPPRYHRPMARLAIIAAILCSFIFSAQASGFDIIGAIAHWTSEQFSFMKMGEEKVSHEKGEFYSLQEYLLNFCVTEPLAPTWFPDGTVCSDIRVSTEENEAIIFATYMLGEEKFYISLQKAVRAPYGEVEINAPDVEIHVAGGIEHHLMADVKQRKAMWHHGDWECYIAGDLTREQLIQMIDSIYE